MLSYESYAVLRAGVCQHVAGALKLRHMSALALLCVEQLLNSDTSASSNYSSLEYNQRCACWRVTMERCFLGSLGMLQA